MRGLLAEDALREYGAMMDVNEFYDAILAATGDAAQADRRTRAREAERLRKGQMPTGE